jgi:hypothetical protein
MYKIFFIIFVLFLFSCNQKNNTDEMEQRIKTLELKVDSLQQSIKWMATTDSILVKEVFIPKEGSLLEEIQKK